MAAIKKVQAEKKTYFTSSHWLPKHFPTKLQQNGALGSWRLGTGAWRLECTGQRFLHGTVGDAQQVAGGEGWEGGRKDVERFICDMIEELMHL